jgi:hypothetical protein
MHPAQGQDGRPRHPALGRQGADDLPRKIETQAPVPPFTVATTEVTTCAGEFNVEIPEEAFAYSPPAQ